MAKIDIAATVVVSVLVIGVGVFAIVLGLKMSKKNNVDPPPPVVVPNPKSTMEAEEMSELEREEVKQVDDPVFSEKKINRPSNLEYKRAKSFDASKTKSAADNSANAVAARGTQMENSVETRQFMKKSHSAPLMQKVIHNTIRKTFWFR